MRRVYLKKKHKIRIGEKVIEPRFWNDEKVIFHTSGEEKHVLYETWVQLGNARICFRRGHFIIIDGAKHEIIPPTSNSENLL